jgi:hypothetical protein
LGGGVRERRGWGNRLFIVLIYFKGVIPTPIFWQCAKSFDLNLANFTPFFPSNMATFLPFLPPKKP